MIGASIPSNEIRSSKKPVHNNTNYHSCHLALGHTLELNICAFCIWILEDGAVPDQNVGVDQWDAISGIRGPMNIDFEWRVSRNNNAVFV